MSRGLGSGLVGGVGGVWERPGVGHSASMYATFYTYMRPCPKRSVSFLGLDVVKRITSTLLR